MKKIILTIAFTLFLSIAAFAQTAADVTGKWYIKSMPQFEKLGAAEKKQAMDALKNCVFHFQKDKKYTVNMMGQTDTGTWKMKGKGIEIISSKGDKPAVMQISKFQKNELRLMIDGMELVLGRVLTK
jgi:hypothetical protein